MGNGWDCRRARCCSPDPLEEFLANVRSEPDCYEDWVTAALETRVAAAKHYEEACAHAIETSGIVEAKEFAGHRAQDLHSLLFEVRKPAPRSVAGVLIMARAVIMAFEEAQKAGNSPTQSCALVSRPNS
jgi:hypothetical protein